MKSIERPWRDTVKQLINPYRAGTPEHSKLPSRHAKVWVVGAELEPGALSAGAASFVVVDFFDFESQATPLLPGLSPAFDFATTFKVRACRQ